MNTLTGTDLEHLAATWLELESRRTEIVEAQADIKSRLRDQLDYGVHPAGERKISITEPQRRFNRERATQILPTELLATISNLAIDTALAKRILSPAVYEACQLPVGEAQVSIR